MQIKALLTVGLVGFAAAAPAIDAVVERRQASVIIGTLDPIKAALTNLDNAVKALAPGGNTAQQTTDLVGKSKAVESAMTSSLDKVKAAQPVSVVEAVQVQTAATSLTNLVKQTIDDFISKKDIIVKAGQQKTVVDNLNAQKTASDAFIAAVISKVPAAVQGVAKSLTDSIGQSLQKGITAFS